MARKNRQEAIQEPNQDLQNAQHASGETTEGVADQVQDQADGQSQENVDETAASGEGSEVSEPASGDAPISDPAE